MSGLTSGGHGDLHRSPRGLSGVVWDVRYTDPQQEDIVKALNRIATALEILAGIRGRTPHLKLQDVAKHVLPKGPSMSEMSEMMEEEPIVPDWDDLDVHERDRLYQWLRVDFEKEHPTAFWHPEDLIAIYRKMSPEGKLEILKAARVVE